jgi:methylthioribulose-1-phosphate dehydratase
MADPVFAWSESLPNRPSPPWREAGRQLAQTGARLAARGWTPATAGNLSQRLDADRAVVTLSGRDKGRLTERDVLLIDLHGRVIEGEGRPSAETPLHLRRYRADPAVGAVLHTHSPAQTVAHRVLGEGDIVLAGYELLKAFSGVATHDTEVRLPVFANSQDMEALGDLVERRLADGGRYYGYLIAGHGIYAWGRDLAEALRHLEAFDFLLTCELELRRLGR